MNDTSPVTCIIPVYNGEAFIGAALESVRQQSHPVTQIIVVDDGSTDGTADVVRSVQDSRIRLVTQGNAGCTAARNHGLRLAVTPFIGLLDADDIWLPDKTARQLALFGRQPGLDACTTLMRNFWMDELREEAAMNPQLALPQPGVFSTFMCRRACVDRIGYLDPEFPNRDLQEWLLRLRESGGQYTVLEEVLVERRLHANNMSRTRPPGENELLDLAARLLAKRRSK